MRPFREPSDRILRGGHRRGPYEKNRRHAVERAIKRFGHGEVACDDLDARGERRLRGLASECAHWRAGTQQLVDDEAADSTCRASHENNVAVRAHHWNMMRPPS